MVFTKSSTFIGRFFSSGKEGLLCVRKHYVTNLVYLYDDPRLRIPHEPQLTVL